MDNNNSTPLPTSNTASETIIDFDNLRTALKKRQESRNRILNGTICVLVCAVFCISLFVIGGVIMLIFGSICISDKDYDLCGSRGGAIAMIIIGVIILIPNVGFARHYIIRRRE